MSQSCYIVTGAGGSIGHAITEELARQGKWVIMACRNLQKDTPLRDRLNSLYNGRVSIMQLDLASLDNIAAFARRIHDEGIKVQALVNNAGVMCKHFSLTCDGYETTIGVNFVGTYLLTKLLIPALSQGSNIVFTTSMTRHIGTVDAHSTKPRQPNMHASNTTPAQNLLSPSSPLTWQNVSPHKAYTSTPPTPVW